MSIQDLGAASVEKLSIVRSKEQDSLRDMITKKLFFNIL